MSDLRLVVGGRAYGGWKSMEVTRSIESISGSFNLSVSDRWAGQSEPWPIREEDECQIRIDGETILSGYVDKRSHSLSATARTLSYSGRDRAAILVDCSAQLGAGKSWSFRDKDIAAVARQIGERYGIKVSVQSGIKLVPEGKCVLNPGDTAYSVLHKMATAAGVLLVSDGTGGLLITRASEERVASSLVEGENVETASVEYDSTDRFHRYVIVTQTGGEDVWLKHASGGGYDVPGKPAAASTSVRAEEIDPDVLREDRVLVIRPEKSMDTATARRRVAWEARVRAARAEKVTVSVPGWREPRGGKLWPVNRIVGVRIPSIGIVGDLLISQVKFSVGDKGETSTLNLVRPDALLPEPRSTPGAGGGGGSGRWRELDKPKAKK
jgi:prophage tail gpP-like protein